MKKINKNKILDEFFQEGKSRSKKKAKANIHDCPEGHEYLHTLEIVSDRLKNWPDRRPAPDTWEKILMQMPARPRPITQAKKESFLSPVALFVLTFPLFIMINVVFFFKDQLVKLPAVQVLKNIWIFRLFGSWDMPLLAFFSVGIFITLMLTPLIILESKSKHRSII